MTLSQTVATLAQHGGRLIFDEDGGLAADFPEDFEPSADLIQSLRAHKRALAEAVLPLDAEREAIQWSDTPGADAALQAAFGDWGTPQIEPFGEDEELQTLDPIFLKADDWLWWLATNNVCGSARDPETGRLWHVREAMARLLGAHWDERWLFDVWSLHRALAAHRPGEIPSILDVVARGRATRTNPPTLPQATATSGAKSHEAVN